MYSKKINDLKLEEGVCRRNHNWEIKELFGEFDIVGVVNGSRFDRWAEHLEKRIQNNQNKF